MPPTGDYPPHKVSIKIKVPRVSISSITKGGRSPALSTETQRRLLEADRRWRAKCILRTLATVFSLIGFSLFAAAVPKWDADFYWGGGPNRGDWQDGFPIAVLVFAFLYNIVMIFQMLHRKTYVMPLVPLIVDFLVWGALVPAITFSAGLGLFEFWHNNVEEDGGPLLWHVLKQIGGLELAAVIFACFVWVLHFVLFILACIDTHKWRKARKANRNHSTRALNHQDFVRSDTDDLAVPAAIYDDRGLGKDIEMSPTSPVAREFV